MEESGQNQAPAVLPLGNRPGAHCIAGCVVPRAGLHGVEKLVPTGIRSPDLHPWRVAMLTELSRHQMKYKLARDTYCLD